MTPKFQSFQEFYVFYLAQHRKPLTRYFHFAGSLIGISTGLIAIVHGPLWMLPLAFVVGYSLAWYSHFYIEGNRPATFGHPFWSFFADWRMAYDLIKGCFRG